MNIKQTLFTLSFLITGLFACTQSKKTNTTETSTVADTSQASIKGCYIYTANRDTFQLAVTAVDKMDVEGSLIYNFFEKDDSKGTFKGKFDGEILKGDYTFQSEGSTSVREVIFKKTQNGFVEGHGEVKETAQKVVFSTPGAITYANGIELTRTDNCLP